MRITSVLKHSLKYTFVSFFSSFISIPKNIILAILLSPADFGIYAFIWLFVEYSNQINPGFINSSTREMTYHIGKKEYEKAKHIESFGNGSDLIFTIIVSILIALFSLFFKKSAFMFYGFIISALYFFISKITYYYHNANYYRDNYNITVLAKAIQNGGASVLLIIMVYLISKWALFIAPLIASILALILYLLKSKYKITFHFSKKTAYTLFKTGFLLSLAWFLWRSFRVIDKSIISIMMTKTDLGLFAFASLFILFIYNAMLDFGNVLMPRLWRFWGDKKPEEFKENNVQYIYFLSLISAVAISFLQLFYYIIVKYIAVKYSKSADFFMIFCFSLFFMAIVIIPNIILAGKNVNKQKISVLTHAFGMVLNIIGDIIVIKSGYGLIGIAWVTLATQIIVSIMQLFFSKKYFATGYKETVKFLFFVFFPAFITLLLYLIQTLVLKYKEVFSASIIYAISLIILWIITFFIIYKNIFRLKDFFGQTKYGKKIN